MRISDWSSECALPILLERSGAPSASHLSWMLVGLAAQLAAAAMLCRLMRVAGEVGARLRERRKAHVRSSRRLLRAVADRPSRMALILGFESPCRRGPPIAVRRKSVEL